MLPTSDERNALMDYMKKHGNTDEAREKAYMDLSECEKYMYTMLPVKDASSKYDCMLFRVQFNTKCEEILESIKTVEKACDEVTTSERLQTVMAMILTLVNQINTGGDGNEAAGFTLEALLKLNEVWLVHRNQMFVNFLILFCMKRQKHLTRKQACCTTLSSL